MSAHDVTAGSESHQLDRRKLRLLAVAGAVVGALAVWVVAGPIAGADLQQPAFDTSAEPQDLGPGMVVVASLVGAGLAWGVMAILERITSNPRRVFTAIGLVALLISFGGPLGGEGISSGNRAALVVMHVVVAAVMVKALRATAQRGSTRTS